MCLSIPISLSTGLAITIFYSYCSQLFWGPPYFNIRKRVLRTKLMLDQ